MVSLVYRLIILNVLVGFWLIGLDLHNNWLRNMFAADQTFISYVIAVLFANALFSIFWHAYRIEKRQDVHQEDIEHIDKSAGWMMMLGLIGTLMGLGFALEGINVDSLASLNGVRDISVKLISGLKTELGVTIIGAIFSIWTEVNYVMVKYRLGKVIRAQQP